METSERIRKLVEAVVEFIYETIDAIDAGKPGLAGELADAKAENAELMRKVAQLEKASGSSLPHCPDPPSPPPPATARPAAGRLEGAMAPLPKYVERKGKKFGCNVQRKDTKLRKGGFATAQEAHDYAVEQIKKSGGDPGGKQRMSSNSKNLPRFVYERDGYFHVLCNRNNVYFHKSGFATAAAASEWAEAEFERKSAGGKSAQSAAGPSPAAETTPTADPPPSAGPAPGNRGRRRTRAELKEAIDESQQQTENS